MFRYASVILVAVLIDGLQMLLSLGLVAIPVIGVGLGFVTDMCFSFVFGSGLLLLLAYEGMFYYPYVLGGSVIELIPGADAVIPGWTLMTLRCVTQKIAEEKGASSTKGSGVFGIVGKFVPEIGAVAAVANVTRLSQATPARNSDLTQRLGEIEQSQRHTTSTLKNFDGIKSSSVNDNRAPESVRYAA